MMLVEILRMEAVMWLFDECQASFAEIAAVLNISRDDVAAYYERAKARIAAAGGK